MTRGEAEFLLFWRDFLAGRSPPRLRGLTRVGPKALMAFEQGLARVALRYLLAQGGAAGGVSLAAGRRSSERALWTEPRPCLRFSQPLLEFLVSLATGKELSDHSEAALGSGDELVILMIADELRARPRADIDGSAVAARGLLASLVFAAGGAARTWPADDATDDVAFFARGRIARGWLEADPVLRAAAQPATLETILGWADERAAAWQSYREHAIAGGRYDLFAPMCEAARHVFGAGGAQGIVDFIERLGQFTAESERQAAYRRLLAGYGWLAELAELGAGASRTKRYDAAFERMQIYLGYYWRVPQAVRAEGERLASILGHRL